MFVAPTTCYALVLLILASAGGWIAIQVDSSICSISSLGMCSLEGDG